jgi:hypothetical protein
MDRALLKRTLKQQATPMKTAVAQKLAYLQGDDVFTTDDYVTPDLVVGHEAEEDIAGAFGGITPQTHRQSAASDVQPMPYHNTEPTQMTPFEEHKQSIAEKIAALRGIKTMPGEYLNNKL